MVTLNRRIQMKLPINTERIEKELLFYEPLTHELTLSE